MRDRRVKQPNNSSHDDDTDKENKPTAQQRNVTAPTNPPAAHDNKRNRAATDSSDQHTQHTDSNNKKSKSSHAHNDTSRHTAVPLSPAPTPSFTSFDGLVAEKDAAYTELLDKYNELRKQKVDATAALVAQYEAQTNQLRSSAQQLTAHWQNKYEQLNSQQQKETALRRKEAEAAIAIKEVALAAKDKQLKENETVRAELERSVAALNTDLSNYMLLTGTSITAPPSSTSSHRLVCCMVNASNRQRRIDFVLDTSNAETDGIIEYRPKRIELGGVAYPKCLKGNINFAVDRTPNFTRYLLDVLYKKEEEEDEAEEGKGENETDKQSTEKQPQTEQEAQIAEQKVAETAIEMAVESIASDALVA